MTDILGFASNALCEQPCDHRISGWRVTFGEGVCFPLESYLFNNDTSEAVRDKQNRTFF